MFWRKSADVGFTAFIDRTGKTVADAWEWRTYEVHAVTNDGQRLLIWAGHTNLRSARATAVGFAKEGIGRHVRETERFRNSALDDNAVITEIELSAPAR